ncbi:MAG: hypothetical protein KF752_15570 [Pirellulaceae bacterium]|nr:hypothetical protein [Pirellulaceae bacterium]
MKFYHFLTTVALVCCGLGSSAQAQIFVALSSSDQNASYTGDASDTGPFDFLAQQEVAAVADTQPAAPSEADPQALGVGHHHRHRSPVDQIIHNSSTQPELSVEHQAYQGIGYGRPTNLIADYMRLQWCADDSLWATHPAERARQCAKQGQRISGAHKHHCGPCTQACNTCPSDATGPVSCGVRPFNRYRAACQNCQTSCDQGSCGQSTAAAGCSSCGQCDGSATDHSAMQPAASPMASVPQHYKVASWPLSGQR